MKPNLVLFVSWFCIELVVIIMVYSNSESGWSTGGGALIWMCMVWGWE